MKGLRLFWKKTEATNRIKSRLTSRRKGCFDLPKLWKKPKACFKRKCHRTEIREKPPQKVVIEEVFDWIELSVFVATDGENYKILAEAKDL